MSFLGSKTFLALNSITDCETPPTLSLPTSPFLYALLPERSHLFTFLPPRAAREIFTADAMQGGGGSRREGFLFSLDSAAFLVLPQLLCFYLPHKDARILNILASFPPPSFLCLWSTSIYNFLPPSPISIRSLCANSNAGYIGQTA